MMAATPVSLELPWLLGVTTCASVVGVSVAESLRKAFGDYAKSQQKTKFKEKKRRWRTLNEFINYMLTAFILVVTSFDKSLLLTAGYPMLWYAFTYVLCILLSDVYSSCFPSPLSPLQQNWHRISNAAYLTNNNTIILNTKVPHNRLYGLYKSVLEYFKLSLPSLIGQFLGLHLGIFWLKIMWGKVLTSYHQENIHVFDKCLPSFKTNTIVEGFVIEFLCTMLFLMFSKFISIISENSSSAKGRSLLNPFKYALFRKVINNLFVILLLFIFLDVTGCYANPFLAYAVQQNCLTSSKNWFIFMIVYFSGPLLATITFCGFIEPELSSRLASMFEKAKQFAANKQK